MGACHGRGPIVASEVDLPPWFMRRGHGTWSLQTKPRRAGAHQCPLESYVQQTIDFVRTHEVWAAPIVAANRLRSFRSYTFFGRTCRCRGPDRSKWGQFLADLDCRIDWRSAGRLALLLDRSQDRTQGCVCLAAIAAPRPDPAWRKVHENLGGSPASSSGAFSVRCAHRHHSSLVSSKCRTGNFKSQTSSPLSCGPALC
jgi:hypothetical protein